MGAPEPQDFLAPKERLAEWECQVGRRAHSTGAGLEGGYGTWDTPRMVACGASKAGSLTVARAMPCLWAAEPLGIWSRLLAPWDTVQPFGQRGEEELIFNSEVS